MSEATTKTPYPPVEGRVSYPRLEEEILAWWKEQGIFERSVERRADADEFVFFDGPPFANGLPHYGHLLTGYVKDVVPRYQTMRGKRVERRFGWDCHGLPAEMKAEKDLGVSGRRQIRDYGIDKFNDYCRESVLRYTSEWREYVTRQARWVDFEDDYKTMDTSYMESVMWAFKQLHDKGLIYEGRRVMPYSWAAETPLSNFEIRLDDATRPRQDPAISVALELDAVAGDPGPLRIVVWTTTPWTLPSNLAVAVGEDIEYALVPQGDHHLVMARAAVARYQKQLGDVEPVATVLGRDLVGRRYTPLFPYFKEHPGAFVVLAGDFVGTEDGTGVVHMAPGFGEDDQRVCEAAGIELVVPVDDEGRFTEPVSDYVGQLVFDANKPIIKALKERGLVLRHDTYEHNYPHCWRTDQPIIYRALDSWYVEVTRFKSRMVELNQQINWIPEHIRDGQFGRWLENARDWSISRNRFWGAPIPVWKSDDPAYPRMDVYGSIEELERDFGVEVTDLHRPFIDQLTRPNPDDPTGKSTMRRVPEVLDCWFESGSMPYAQLHYPFENKELFEKRYPGDFIVEYTAQTRGWFYTLMVLGTALFDKPPFLNCICHGTIGAEDGRKLSKRLGNYLDPLLAFEQFGSDALRWRLMSSPLMRGLELRVDAKGQDIAEVVRLILNPIWNAYVFFRLYANADGYRASLRTDSSHLLDRYVLAKLRELIEGVTTAMDALELGTACEEIRAFLDALNNWYIRRSRERFWGAGDEDDKYAAYDTLYTVLVTFSQVAAPLLPLLTEAVYRGLTGEGSVHLTDWPDPEALPADADLVREMDRVREVCSVAHAIREDNDLRARLPLASLTVAGPWAPAIDLPELRALISDEVNVKAVAVKPSFEEHAELRLRPDGRALGPRLGKDMKSVMAAANKGEWERRDDGSVSIAGQVLAPEEFDLRLAAFESTAMRPVATQDALVMLDTAVTPELHAEGVARDLVRLIQNQRKEQELEVSDRIELYLELPDAQRAMVEPHLDYVAEQVLAERIVLARPQSAAVEATLDGADISLALRVHTP